MDTQICVNCHNNKGVNQTTNRLVTESCGHVKCMNCLLEEKSGCNTCTGSNGVQKEKNGGEDNSKETKTLPTEVELTEFTSLPKKTKPDTTHIRVESDADGVRWFICTICKKKAQSRTHVAYHAYCNGQRKPFQCPECKQSFATQSHFNYHMRVHRNERTYSCDICAMSFIQMSKLKRHKLKHTKEKKYSCTQCNKAFNNTTALKKHNLTHTEERPYSCNECGHRFRDSSNYRKHLEKHKAEARLAGCKGGEGGEGGEGGAGGGGARRRHQCPRCPQAFHSGKDMRRHAAVHSDSKPFRCKLCDRRFRRKDNLERHIRNTHPDFVPATAVECDETALQKLANGHTDIQTDLTGEAYEKNEKTKLEILNPLPPLPQEVIQKHISVATDNNGDVTSNVIDKLSIIEANNARQSVIVEKRKADVEKKVPSPENEYVHKIRKATIPLPPIDQEKFQNVKRGFIPDSMRAVAPIKNVEIYKKILYEKVDKEPNEVIQNPKMHWRRKMEQDIN